MQDFNISPGPPAIEEDLSLIKQQLDILFDCTPGDLHGDTSFGTSYEYLLYDLRITAEQLEQRAWDDVCSINLRGYTPTVKAYLLQGSQRDIAIIDIQLKRSDGNYRITYKID